MERRIQSATKAYGALQKRPWRCNDIGTKNQSEGLLSCSHPLPALFHRGHHSLPQAHCGSDKSPASPPTLSDILNIKWQDRIPGVEVLRRAHTVSVEALITVSQLRRWAGLVRRMANSRLPKAVFYSELRHMKKTGISNDTWEEEAVQRIKRRGLLRKATSAVEGQPQQEYQRAHVRRHSTATSSSSQCNNRQRHCGSRAGLTAHTRACLRQAATQIQDSHVRQRRTAIIIYLV